MHELNSIVDRHLREQGSDEDTRQLWKQVFDAFDSDGPEGVENLLGAQLDAPEEN